MTLNFAIVQFFGGFFFWLFLLMCQRPDYLLNSTQSGIGTPKSRRHRFHTLVQFAHRSALIRVYCSET